MRTCAALLLLAVLAAPAARAQEIRPWLSGGLTWAGYEMTDPNREFDMLNTLFVPDSPGLEHIDGAVGFTLAGGLDFSNHLTLGAGYQRLPAWSEGGDPSLRLEYNLAGNAFFASAGYRVPLSLSMDLGFDLDAGIVSTSGKLGVRLTGYGSESLDISGSGPYLAGGAHLDWWASPLVGLSLRGGWRHAVSDHIEVRDQAAFNADGSDYRVDYSGLALGAGIKVVLPR